MQLRIIDKKNISTSSEQINGTPIEIIFEGVDYQKKYMIDSYQSPLSSNFRALVDWYFAEYLTEPQSHDDRQVSEKLIKIGQYLGDELLGEDYQQIAIKDHIEAQGYPHLMVSIESDRACFLAEPWELLVLHESNYILSSVVNGFIKQPLNSYDNATLTAPQKLSIGQVQESAKTDVSVSQFKFFRFISQTLQTDSLFDYADVLSWNFSQFEKVNEQLLYDLDWTQCQQAIKNKSHDGVFHFSGYIYIDQQAEYYFCLGADQKIKAEDFFQFLVQQQINLVCLEAYGYLCEIEPHLCAGERLAQLANLAFANGINNLVGLSHIANPWVNAQCFHAFYEKLLGGGNLAQIVVEARKQLQVNTSQHLIGPQARAFSGWPLLIHYAVQTLNIVNHQVNTNDPFAAQPMPQDGLYGFKSRYLPPLLNNQFDKEILTVVSQLEQTELAEPLVISGEFGSGKTHLAHCAALKLKTTQNIQWGFYFSYQQDFFSVQDIFDMVAPVIKQENNRDAFFNGISEHCCLFVFDDFISYQIQVSQSNNAGLFNQSHLTDKSELIDATAMSDLVGLITQLIEAGQKVLILGQPQLLPAAFAHYSTVTLKPDLVGQALIAAHAITNRVMPKALGQTDVTNNEEQSLAPTFDPEKWQQFLALQQHNYWLTEKTIPMLKAHSLDDLSKLLKQEVVGTSQSVAEVLPDAFFKWQWDSLPAAWQILLCHCADTPGLLLEMLMIVFDAAEQPAFAKQWFELFSLSVQPFSQLLDQWEDNGLIVRYPHGRLLDAEFRQFILNQKQHSLSDEKYFNSEICELLFSQIICEGVRLLANNVVSQPGSPFTNNLLINRRVWATHMEKLWFAGELRAFVATKNAFEQLLAQAKIVDEGHQWVLSLLKRSKLPSCEMVDESTESIERILAWLMLATQTLSVDKGDNPIVEKLVRDWQPWLMSFDLKQEKLLAIFQQVATFLDNYYQVNQQWKNGVIVIEKLLLGYQHYQAKPRIIECQKTLARYFSKLEKTEQCLAVEQEIIDTLQADEVPSEIVIPQLIDIMNARLLRKDLNHAANLFEMINAYDDISKFASIISELKAELNFLQGNYQEVLPIYCEQWEKLLRNPQPELMTALAGRLKQIQQALGNELFESLIPENIAPDLLNILNGEESLMADR
ncbi:hypothetical protein [Aliikangiella maris]|uniref:Uncharacterized protein n=2 Tax=Aliikangiella maris TaxID=3162458 RepID=A0ABV3MPN3_9GAMM